jgi:hypothetical protein
MMPPRVAVATPSCAISERDPQKMERLNSAVRWRLLLGGQPPAKGKLSTRGKGKAIAMQVQGQAYVQRQPCAGARSMEYM